jgi:AmiR/NasT family two-component response regulator
MRDKNIRTSDGASPADDPAPALMQVLHRLTEVNERLTHMAFATDSRDLVEQAKGMLMERYGILQDEALKLLMTVSRNNRMELADVAATLVHSGQLPITTDHPG